MLVLYIENMHIMRVNVAYCGNLLAQNTTKIISLLLHAIFIQMVNKQ